MDIIKNIKNMEEEWFLTFVSSPSFDHEYISKLVSYEKAEQVSLLGDVFSIFNINTVEKIISVLKLRTSSHNVKSLLHDDPLNLTIPFERHLVSRCYAQYGISNTKILLSRHYHSDPIFVTLPLQDGRSILQKEDDLMRVNMLRNFYNNGILNHFGEHG